MLRIVEALPLLVAFLRPPVPQRAAAPAPPRPAASSGRKPLPPRKPGDCAGVSRAPPPPKPATFNDDDEHVVKYAAPAPAAYGFKSVNGTGETGAVESNDVDEDEWN